MFDWVNQHSLVAVGVVVLGVAWYAMRGRGRFLRRVLLLALVALLAVGALGLRTTGSTTAEFDRALASDEPVVVEFFSNY